MTGKLCVEWTLVQTHPPCPWRHCATCGVTRAFQSSGKVRLNANSRRLDAWLIYRCIDCDRTWLRTLVERQAVHLIPRSDLEAMQQSAPAWVRGHEFDVDALRRDAGKITHSDDVRVVKPDRWDMDQMPHSIELALIVPSDTGLRLDRFLSQALPVSRTRLRAAHAHGGLQTDAADKSALRRKVNADMSVTLFCNGFPKAEFARICEAVFADERA